MKKHLAPNPTSRRMRLLRPSLAALACITLVNGGTAHAQDSEKQELARLRATTEALIEALVSQGLLTRERADTILRNARSAGDRAAATAPEAAPTAAGA